MKRTFIGDINFASDNEDIMILGWLLKNDGHIEVQDISGKINLSCLSKGLDENYRIK